MKSICIVNIAFVTFVVMCIEDFTKTVQERLDSKDQTDSFLGGHCPMDMSAKCNEVKSIFVATLLPAIGIDDHRFL